MSCPPQAWLMDDIGTTLQAIDTGVQAFVQQCIHARTTDLDEVDPIPLRLLRQRLQQGVGALAVLELDGIATTLRALDGVLARLVYKPASATPSLADAVTQGVAAVWRALQHRARGTPCPELALFSTYESWQKLAGAAAIHPADLWQAPAWAAPWAWPEGKSYQPSAAVRAHWDRLILPLVKERHPRAAATLAQLCAGLGRGCANVAAPSVFWLAAAAYFEALAAHALPNDGYVWRTPSRILRQYVQLAQGSHTGLTALTHELLFWSAQAFVGQPAVASAPCWSTLRQAWGAALPPVWDYHDPVPAVDATPPGPMPATAELVPPDVVQHDPNDVADPFPRAVAGGADPLLLQVSTEWLERLMLHTGDVILSRAQLEAHCHTMQQACRDMASHLDRVRLQLRELELHHATAQSAAQAATTCDPLVLERGTQVQELTRLLVESVEDVATVQSSWQRALLGTETGLAAQARQTRELQREVLRTRRLATDAITERLRHVVQQAAQAQGQPVQFEVQGGALVLERDLLMRLLPVLEYVLHQWVVHGVQPSAQGEATDHAPQRRLTLTWRQQGHDMVVTLSHDGLGWSAEAGTLAGAAELLCPLGGQLTCVPSAGVGVRLEWVLPWCATVTRVVLLRVADVVLAVPTPWVEVVLRASARQVQAARASGVWVMPSGGTVPFDNGGRVLGLRQEVDGVSEHFTNPFTGVHHQPVLVFHSTGQRVAWHVDEVLGHQEVWVKPPGPQLTHLPGVVGATVLPLGRVALLYDPVRVTVHYRLVSPTGIEPVFAA